MQSDNNSNLQQIRYLLVRFVFRKQSVDLDDIIITTS